MKKCKGCGQEDDRLNQNNLCDECAWEREEEDCPDFDDHLGRRYDDDM